MSGWLGRLIGRPAAPPPAPVPSPAVAPGPARDLRPGGLPIPSPTPGDATAAACDVPAGFGTRQLLVGRRGQIAGFELALPQALRQRLASREDPVAAAAHHALLLAAASGVCGQRRHALVSIPAALLGRSGVASHAPPGALLCVDGLAALPPALTATLRSAGVRLGVPEGPPAAAPAADFVLLRHCAGGLDTLLLSAQHWRQTRPGVPLVAIGLTQLEDVERLLRNGFALAGGTLDRTRQSPVSRPLSAAAQRLCELLSHLALDHDTAVVAESLRGDVALSYRLLRYANSPALGLRRAVESIDDAVNLLGRQELNRWLSVLLLTVGSSRQASRALQELALARGRLLEELARERGEPAPGTLFTVGMLSLIELLLELPLSEALGPLRLSPPVRDALLARRGPYAVYLELAQALDGEDGALLDRLAGPWGGPDAVRAHAEQAWIWARGMAEAMGTAEESATDAVAI